MVDAPPTPDAKLHSYDFSSSTGFSGSRRNSRCCFSDRGKNKTPTTTSTAAEEELEKEMEYKDQVAEIEATAHFGDLIEFSYPIGYSHWGVYDGDGYVIHFAVADETQVMNTVRGYLQTMFPVCGDLLLGETRIRRQHVGEINVPKGARVLVSNTCHTLTPSNPEDMQRRRDALLDKQLPYKIFTQNCEHFATFVRYGKAVCNQIPGRTKNKECEEATKVFKDIVWKETS